MSKEKDDDTNDDAPLIKMLEIEGASMQQKQYQRRSGKKIAPKQQIVPSQRR